MITNFEEITLELSEKDLELLPLLKNGFLAHTEKNPIKAPEIVRLMNEYFKNSGRKPSFSEPKLRKFVNHFRRNSILPLCATPEGYFVTQSVEILKSQIKSLDERSNSIKSCADGMRKFL